MAGEVGALRITLGINSGGVTQELKNVNNRLFALNAEFRAVSTGAARFDTSLEALRTRSDVLTRTMSTHRTKVEELRRQYEQSKATKGEDADETLRLATAYNRAVAAMNRTEEQLRNVNTQIQEQNNEFKQLSNTVNTNVADISRELRVLETGFNAAEAGMDGLTSEADRLRRQEDNLNQTLNLQSRRVDELARLHRASADATGENSQETQELAIRLNRATQEMRETERRLSSTTQELEEQTDAWRQLRNRITDAGNDMQEVGGNMQSVGSEISQSFGAAFLAVGAGLGLSAKKAMDFESQMSSVKSVMSPDEAKEFGKALEDLSLQMGAETKYSALEAAQGIEELIKAGVSVTDIIKGGLDGALSLATAGELELADAAEIASTALNAFKDDNLSVMRAADLLAGAANASATSVSEMKFGLSMVSAVASGLGLSFEDTSTALALFANNGLKGSDAGTSLKTMLSNLVPKTEEAWGIFQDLGLMAFDAAKGMEFLAENGIKPTSNSLEDVQDAVEKYIMKQMGAKSMTAEVLKEFRGLGIATGFLNNAFFDTNGEVESMSTIAGVLQTALKDLSSEQRQTAMYTLFGSDAIRAGNILYKEGAIGIENMAAAMNKIKSADVAAEKLNNVKGRIEELKGSIETAAISLGDALLPTIDKVVAGVQGMTNTFNSLSPEMKTTIANTGLVVAGLTGVVTALGITLAVGGAAISGFGALTTVLGSAGFAGALAALTGPIGLTVVGLGLAAGAVYALKGGVDEGNQANLEYVESLMGQQQPLEELIVKYESLREKNNLSNYELLRFRDIQSELKTATAADEITKLKDESEKLREKSGLSNEQLSEMLTLNDQLIEKVPTSGQAISDQGNKILKTTNELREANKELREKIKNELENQRILAEENINDNIKQRTQDLIALNEVRRELNSEQIEAQAKEYQLSQLIKEQQDLYAQGQDHIAEGMNADIELLEQQVEKQYNKVAAVAEEVQKKDESLQKTDKEIEKAQKVYEKLLNLQLAHAGINAEGAEGISQLDQAISKTSSQITELRKVEQAQGGLNAEQQKELDNLSQALGKYGQAQEEIRGIQSEQAAVNGKIDAGSKKAGEMSDILSASEIKRITFSGDGYTEAKIISDESSREVMKEVNVTDYGRANTIHNNAERTATKKVSFTASLTNGFKNAVKAFEKVTGINVPGFKVGTRNAPGGMAWVGEEGPELMYVPKGSRIIPNRQSEQIMRSWNIPVEQKQITSIFQGASTSPSQNTKSIASRDYVTPEYVAVNINLDSHSMAKALAKPVKTEMDLQDKLKSTFQGGVGGVAFE